VPTQLEATMVLQNGMHFRGSAGSGHAISTDYPMGSPTSAGSTPLELLLMSLAACSGGSMAVLLRKAKQQVGGIEVRATGKRRDEHPTCLTDISLEFVLRGERIDPSAVQQAMTLSEQHLCPVWAMLKGSTRIEASFRIEGAGAHAM